MTTQISPKPRGTYIHRDTRYVSEFASWQYPKATAMFNVRVGPTPAEISGRYPNLNTERWARVWLKTCDLILIDQGQLLLCEGELRRPVVAIGELLVYRELVRQTVSLQAYWRLPIRTIMITPLSDPTIEPVLKHLGIETAIYRPRWAEDYLREVQRL